MCLQHRSQRFAVILATQRRQLTAFAAPSARRTPAADTSRETSVRGFTTKRSAQRPVGQSSFSARLFILRPRMTAFDREGRAHGHSIPQQAAIIATGRRGIPPAKTLVIFVTN